MTPSLVALIGVAILVLVVLVKGALIVPQKNSVIVERLGKFNRALDAGFHILIPFMDRPAYKFSMKEQVSTSPHRFASPKTM